MQQIRPRHLPRENVEAPPPEGSGAWKLREWLLVAALVAGPLLAFSSVLSCDFVNYDDPIYVTENGHVRGGLAWNQATWALTTSHHGNWHPLVWLSFQLDAQLFKMNPAGFHLTNLFWHTGSVLLLFFALRRMTGQTWPSALAAALFAVHPLNVEPVAWVSERKGVLSTFFWMFTLWAYARYAERPRPARYAWVVLGIVLGLMAKPMLVTLPCVLLLLDCWPLGRFQRTWAAPPTSRSGWRICAPRHPSAPLHHLVLEKVPLLVLAGVFCVLAVKAQGRARALPSPAEISIPVRLKNMLESYLWYLERAVYPSKLAPFYPHPGNTIPTWRLVASAGILAGLTVLTLYTGRRRLYLLVGWLWYLGALVPVCGLIQVGLHARADRYGYIPLIGVFIILAWCTTELVQRCRCPRVVAGGVVLVLVIFLAISRKQVHYWQDSVTLWEHTLEVTERNFVAHNNLGFVLLRRGQNAEAVAHFRSALQFRPSLELTRITLDRVLATEVQEKKTPTTPLIGSISNRP